MSYFLSGFIDELIKTSSPTDLAMPAGQSMEVKAPKPPKPLTAPKPVTMESKPGLPKTAGIKDMLGPMKGAIKKMIGRSNKGGKLSGRAGQTQAMKTQIPVGDRIREGARKAQEMTAAQWAKLTPRQKQALSAGAGGAAVGVVGAKLHEKLSSEDKAGKTVKEVIENAKGKRRPEAQAGDEYGAGGGLSNFEGKGAKPFNKKYNPTDMPQAFGKR